MTDDSHTPKRPKRWLAFLLNFIFPPAGYVYAGMPRIAVGYVAVMALAVLALSVWTINLPPGLYGFGFLGPDGLGALAVTVAIRIVVGLHAAWQARPRSSVKGVTAWVLAVVLVLISLGAGLVARVVVPYRFYDIPSGSMIPTLKLEDVVLVKGGHEMCRTPGLSAGMMVTEKKNGAIFIRRLIAGPGQTIEMTGGRLIIDGRPVKTELVRHDAQANADILRETLANGASYLVQDMASSPYDDFDPVTVPQGRWFVLGDNRDNSMDSRVDGPAPASQICGRAIKIIASKDKAAIGRPL
jgi:signal peptidase I